MTDALDTLRPEVQQALAWLKSGVRPGTRSFDGWSVIRAELVRLAEYEQAAGRLAIEKAEFRQRAEKAEAELAAARKNETVALGLWNAAEGRATKAEAELAESRETIKRLNRRVQVAEAGVADKVKASGGGFGRSLANAAAAMFMRERDEARAELAALKARIAEAPVATLVISSAAGDLTLVWAENPDDWASRRVRLVVEE